MAVVVPILSTFNPAGVNAAAGALGALGNSLKRMGLQAAAAAAGVKAMGAAVDFVSESVTNARDLERNLFALNTVFGDLAPRMEAFTKSASGMGISQVAAARTATYLGSVLKQAGFGMEQTATETENLTVLAQDLATTYGYDVSEALTAMTALFRGEYDPIEKFGVALKQNEINSLLAAKGMSNLTGQALLNAQQQIRLEQLYKRSADAQGAFAAQSHTLYGVQARLNATFENTKTALGQELLPILTKFGETLIPIANAQGPKLQNAFKGLSKVIEGLQPLVEPLVRIFGDLVGALGSLMIALGPVIEYIANATAYVLDEFANKLESVGRGVDELVKALGTLFALPEGEDGNKLTNWAMDTLKPMMQLVPILREVYKIWEVLLGRAGQKQTGLLDETDRFIRQHGDRLRANTGKGDGGGDGNGDAKKKATDYIKEFYAALADEDRKQRASLKLKSLGATQGVIESIIGSGDGWFAVYKSIISGGEAAITKVQSLFSTTKAGIAELQKEVEESSAAYAKLVDEQFDIYQKEKAAYDERIDAIDKYKTALLGLSGAVKPLAFIEREIGRLESAVVASFDNMRDSIQQGVIDKMIAEDAAKSLQAYADKEMAILAKLAKQRDELRAKYDLADALIKETRSAVTAYANITAMLDKQTTTVTETIQTMVDGVRLTRTSTREQITEGKNLVDSFKEILEKTVQFGKNLKQLRALGLDKNLYKQIVDAGLEAGGATAAAIIDGGAGTVSELNSLFGQLDAVGADIAETSATVMFNNGVDIVGGLLEGLKSQDAMLVAAAESMATSFANAFNAMLSASITMPKAVAAPAFAQTGADSSGSYFLNSIAGLEGDALAKQVSMLTGQDVSAPGSFMNTLGYMNSGSTSTVTNNVYVQAGVIANKAELPSIVVDALNTATKQGLNTRMFAV
jgi:hypothetical protein